MITYTKNEMVGITQLSKSLGKYLDKVIANPLNRVVITRRNKPAAVIVPVQEYERIREASDYLEDMDIAKMLDERVFNIKEPAKMIAHKEMMDSLRKAGRSL